MLIGDRNIRIRIDYAGEMILQGFGYNFLLPYGNAVH